jgi:hypothetical protein
MNSSDDAMLARDRNENPPKDAAAEGCFAPMSCKKDGTPLSAEQVGEKRQRSNANEDGDSKSSWLPKRKIVAMSSITVSGLEPIQETESMYKEKWVDTAKAVEAPLKKPKRVASEASCIVTKVSCEEENNNIPLGSGMPSSASTSTIGSSQTIPSSIFKISNHDSSISIVSDFKHSLEEGLDDGDSNDSMLKQGDTTRWQALSTPKSDHSPGLPKRLDSKISEGSVVSPTVDRPPGIPCRHISECVD